MTDYLLAECIVKYLEQYGIIDSPETWKKTVIGTLFYYADFIHANTGSLMSFRITVLNGAHVISVNAFTNHARFFNINPAEVLEKCKI